MIYRPLGRTGLDVSILGFGGYGIGGGYLMQDRSEALRAISAAADHGINYFDTAPFVYNDSETLLGKALKSRRDKVILASKAELLHEKSIRDCVETSLRQLQTDRLDILQLRDPSEDQLPHFLETCTALIKEGKLRFPAVTVGDTRQREEALRSIAMDVPVIQLAYNIIFSVANEEVLPKALETNTAIVARGPLCKGFLSDRLTQKPSDIQAHPNFRWFTSEEADTLLSLQRALAFLVTPRRTLAQAAIQFVIQNPAISTTIPSLETVQDVQDLLSALEAPPLTESEITQALKVIRDHPPIDY